jgi:hypothetical protein
VQEVLAALGIKSGTVAAACAGGVVSYILFKTLAWSELLISMLSGVLVAIFVGPLVAEAVKASEKTELGITFLMGVLGVLAIIRLAEQIPLWLTGLREKWMR